MKYISTLLYILLVIITLCGCSKQFDNDIETELQVHFDNFVTEAEANGVAISLDEINIGAYIENIETRGTLGQCKSYSDGSKQVAIDLPFWNIASDLEREYVVFHELGHCILGREHNDKKDANGICMSIMQSGDNDCSGIYTSENRNSLLIELFDF